MIWLSVALGGPGLVIADPTWRGALGEEPVGLDSRAARVPEAVMAGLIEAEAAGQLEPCPGGWLLLGLGDPWQTGPACLKQEAVWADLGAVHAYRVVLPASGQPPEGLWVLGESRPTAVVQRVRIGDAKAEGLAATALRDIRSAAEALQESYPIVAVNPAGATEGWRGREQSGTATAQILFVRGTDLAGFTAAAAGLELALVEAWAPTEQVGVAIGGPDGIDAMKRRFEGALDVRPW